MIKKVVYNPEKRRERYLKSKEKAQEYYQKNKEQKRQIVELIQTSMRDHNENQALVAQLEQAIDQLNIKLKQANEKETLLLEDSVNFYHLNR